MFWKRKNDAQIQDKNVIGSDEYGKLVHRLSEIDAKLKLFESVIEIFKTNLDDLRGKFNRKLKGLEKEEKKQESQMDETETINNGGYVGFG